MTKKLPEHADVYLRSQAATNAVTSTVRKRLEKFNKDHSDPGMEPLTVKSSFPKNITCTGEDLAIARKIETALGIFVNQTRDLFLIATEDSTLEYVSQACHDLLGYNEGDLVGTKFLDLVYPGDYQATVELMRMHMPKRHVYNFTNRLRTCLGGVVSVEWAATAWSLNHKTYARIRPSTPSTPPSDA